MQAEEARVAVRAAEIATKVALEAQAVAESALAELHAATVEPMRGPAIVEQMPAPQHQTVTEKLTVAPAAAVEAPAPKQAAVQAPVAAQAARVEPAPPPIPEPHYELPFAVRWDPDLPTRTTERVAGRPRVQEEFELSAEDWWSPGESSLRNEPIEVVEGEPAHANLIQFPRELVATRKMRPRLAESYPGAAAPTDPQLSIFEVDPHVVSTVVEPVVESATPEASAAAAAWTGPEWSGIQLGAHPAAVVRPAPVEEGKSTHLAPLGVRMMATVVDCSLILACFVCVGFVAAANMTHVPVGKPAELLGGLALIAVGMLYYAFFFNLGVSTPGMKYAGVGLCTFDDQSPTRAQLRRRLVAMILSLLPVGLGVAWAIFDEDHMSWHDRYSRTYLRKC